MDVKTSAERFDQAVSPLPSRIRAALNGIPRSVKATVSEVRLRVGRPVALSCPGRSWFVDSKSQLHNIPKHCFVVEASDLSQAVVSLCSYSVHTHQQEFIQGYISLQGGHRAGICGRAVTENGRITAVRDVTSINLRIAREIRGAATPLIRQVLRNDLCGMLVVGIPSSGKTTILRDLARQLADGETGRHVKVAVVDERGELGAVFEGVPQNDLGASCDILSSYPKGAGILTAVRTLSPEIVICDEIGGKDDVDSILDGLNCGVKVIASAHAGSMEELLSRRQILRLLQNGAFDVIVRLGGAESPGTIEEIVEAGEQSYETGRRVRHRSMLLDGGDVPGVRFVPAGCDD